ncbi:MAG: Rpn family recombination-promoting nuclease/putative transposase, partial [Symploca sp. SIO2E6]|nr:Rpn family recombination-promoting nuclease/putative transposase [Symploca sp. SIO2E6]
DYFHRMLYGVSNLITEYLDKGQEYGEIRKVYSVNIVYFNLGKGNDYIYRLNSDFIGMNTGDILELTKAQEKKFNIKKVADIFPEYYLLKVRNFQGAAETTLQEWIYFLRNSEIKDEFAAKGMVEAKEALRVNNLSETERAAYDSYMDNKSYEASILSTQEFEAQWQIEQIEEAQIRGIQQGSQQRTIEIARSCKQQGLDIETIMAITQLSREDIEAL